MLADILSTAAADHYLGEQFQRAEQAMGKLDAR
jgi:hypothetical protein